MLAFTSDWQLVLSIFTKCKWRGPKDQKERGAAAPLSRFSLAVPTDQNFTTTVPLTVRGAPIWTKPGLP